MTQVAGLKIEKYSSGKIKSVTVDMKRWGYLMEDVLDAIQIDKAKASNDYAPWEDVKKKLNKKHGIK